MANTKFINLTAGVPTGPAGASTASTLDAVFDGSAGPLVLSTTATAGVVALPAKITAFATGASFTGTVTQATAANLNATVVGTVNVTQATAANLLASVTGSVIATQATAANLNATVAGTVTVVQATAANLNVSATFSNSENTTTQTAVTITTSNAFKVVLATGASRKGAFVQYISVAGTVGYVFFGTTPGDTTTSFQLSPGQILSANFGGNNVATDQIVATGTATDIFIVASQ